MSIRAQYEKSILEFIKDK